MKHKYRFTALLLITVAACACLLTGIYRRWQTTEEDTEKVIVVTSFYPMYIATENVAGDCTAIEVKNLSEPQTGSLHDFQLTPEEMKLLSTADMFVINGGGMESFLDDVTKQYPKLNIVETIADEADEADTDGRETIHGHEDTPDHAEETEHTHSHEEDADEHGNEEGSHEHGGEKGSHDHGHTHDNAHEWMSVSHYRSQVEKIKDAMCEAFPEYQEVFQENAKAYDDKLAALQAQQEEIARAASGTKIITFHEAYEYVAEDYGLDICYTMDLDEERQISAGEVADVLKEINENDVKIILAEELYGSKLAETIQKEADVNVYYLDTLVRGDYDKESYIKGMQENINILKAAFGVD